MAEQPEHVLPQDRVPALQRVEEVAAEADVEHQLPQGDADDRHREQHQERDVTRVIQVNTGIRMSVMPGARMLRIVTMKLTAEPAMRHRRSAGPGVEQHP
jgi:hypothetical protein